MSWSVYGVFTPGVISATGQTICYNTNPTTEIGNSTAASGGDTTITYSWRSSADSFATAISGATSSTYIPAGPLAVSTSFQRYAKDNTCNTTPEVSTGSWTVSVYPDFTTGAIAATGDTICYGGDPDLIGNETLASGGYGTIWCQWQYSATDAANNFTDIDGASSSAYDPPSGLTETTWYRRMAKDSTCNTTLAASTGVRKVLVYPTTIGGDVTGGALVCYGTNSTLLTLSNQVGTVRKWQYSTDGSQWKDISSHTATTYTAVNLTVYTYYRAVVKSGVCLTENSISTQITMFTNYRISGYARYNNNPTTLLNGLKIILVKNLTLVDSVITTSNGFYQFSNLTNGTYKLQIISAHPSRQWQTWNGVNNTDYLLAMRHATTGPLLPENPPVARISGDVKLPKTPPEITVVDADAIRMAAKFGWGSPKPYFDIPKWVFSGVTLETPIDNIALNCANVTRDIRRLCAGDVNGTHLPLNGYKIAEPSLELVNRGTLPITSEITFPVRAERDMELGAITLMLDYDPAIIQITGVTMPENGGVEPWFLVQSSKFKVVETPNLKPGTWNPEP